MASQLDQRSELCYNLVFKAVNENSLSKLQLANGIFSPIELLNSLAQCNEEAETPLTVGMKRKNVSVIKEMVTWMLKYQDHLFHEKECQSMPIFIIDQLSHHIPVLESEKWYDQYGHNHGINFNVYRGERKSCLELIDLVFLQSTSLTRQDKITTLELIGALAIIHCCELMPRFALKCWREAMTLRYFPQDGEPLLPKVPAICVPTQASSVIFGSAAEIVTMEELKFWEEDFERNSSFNSESTWLFKERFLIQALLVMRRIFTQANLGNPHWLYLESVLEYAIFLDMREKIEVKNFSAYIFIFEQLNGSDPKLLSRRSFDVFTSTISSTLYPFSLEMYNPAQEEDPGSDNPARVKLVFDILLALTKFIATISEFFPNPAMISSAQFHRYHFAEIVYFLLCLLMDISSQITDQEKHQLEEQFSYFIRNFFPERTTTVLHVAAMKVKNRSDLFKIVDDLNDIMILVKLKPIHTQIKLILQLGADPNSIDRMGRTPLHILAANPDSIDEIAQTPLHILAGIKEHHLKEYLPVFQTLVDAGSHLYLADDNGETVISLLKEIVERDQNNDEIRGHHYFESLINDVFPLTWFCARVIRQHGIPFKDRLPLALQKLVSL